jgi:hypothetical protein
MVKVHRRRRKPSSTIGARPVAKAIQRSRLRPPQLALSLDVSGRTLWSRWSSGVSPLGSDPMAVGTDDVAFRRLAQERRRGPKHRAARGQPESFRTSIAVIEVHLVRGKRPSAVDARSRSKLPEEFDGAVLTNPHPLELECSIPLVVRNVRRPLPAFRHAMHDRTNGRFLNASRSGMTRDHDDSQGSRRSRIRNRSRTTSVSSVSVKSGSPRPFRIRSMYPFQ